MSTERARSEYQRGAGREPAAGHHGRGEQPRRERGRQGLGGKPGGHRHARDGGEQGASGDARPAGAAGARLRGVRPAVVAVLVTALARPPALERVVAEPADVLEHLVEDDLVGVEHHLEGGRAEARGRAHDALGVLQGALELEGAVGAVEAGDVRQSLLVAIGAAGVENELAGALLVAVARTVRGAVRGGADAARVAGEVVVGQQVVVEAHVQQTARHVGRHVAHAPQAAQPVAELLDALGALGAARQYDGQVEGRGRHGRPGLPPAASRTACGMAARPPSPVSTPCRTCSSVMSSSRRMWSSSGA